MTLIIRGYMRMMRWGRMIMRRKWKRSRKRKRRRKRMWGGMGLWGMRGWRRRGGSSRRVGWWWGILCCWVVGIIPLWGDRRVKHRGVWLIKRCKLMIKRKKNKLSRILKTNKFIVRKRFHKHNKPQPPNKDPNQLKLNLDPNQQINKKKIFKLLNSNHYQKY